MYSDLSRYLVTDEAKAVYNVKPGMYFNGKLIVKVGEVGVTENMRTLELDTWAKVLMDDGEYICLGSHLGHKPTTEVPRKYRKHINLQKLEDRNS